MPRSDSAVPTSAYPSMPDRSAWPRARGAAGAPGKGEADAGGATTGSGSAMGGEGPTGAGGAACAAGAPGVGNGLGTAPVDAHAAEQDARASAPTPSRGHLRSS